MPRISIPSLQHLARNWNADPNRIKKSLVDLAQNPPHFNYNPLFNAVRDMLLFSHPYSEIAEGIRRAIPRESVRKNLIEILPLVQSHFDGIKPDFIQDIDVRFYSVGRGLMVPFRPPLIYGVGGQIYFPWFSFWRTRALDGERLALFVSIVDEVLGQDPELEDADFHILDFSCVGRGGPRVLRKVDTKIIPRVSQERRNEMLRIFAEGYFMAQSELAQKVQARQNQRSSEDHASAEQEELLF